MSLPVFRREQTGSHGLDRIQAVVEDLVNFVRDLATRAPFTLTLRQPFSTTSSLPQDTKLTFPVRKDELWHVEFWGNLQCSSTDGVRTEIGAPAGSEIDGWWESSASSISASNWTATRVTSVNTLNGAFHYGADNNPRPDRFSGRIKAGGDGAITLRVASSTDATTTILSAKATLRASRMVGVPA